MMRTFWQEDQAVLRKEKVQQKVQQNFRSGSGGLQKSMFPMDSSRKLDILRDLGKK